MPGFGNLVLGSDLRELIVLHVPSNRWGDRYSGDVREVEGVGELGEVTLDWVGVGNWL